MNPSKKILVKALVEQIPDNEILWYDIQSVVNETTNDNGFLKVTEKEFWDCVAHHSYFRTKTMAYKGYWMLLDPFGSRVRVGSLSGFQVLQQIDSIPTEVAVPFRWWVDQLAAQ